MPSFQNQFLDAAFHGNPFLEQDEKDAFQNGRHLAYLTIAVHAVALLKQQGLSELAAHTLDIKHHPYDIVVRQTDKHGSMDLEPSDDHYKISHDGYRTAMNIFQTVLKADI